MTLPDRVLARLAEIDGDRAKAVVKAVETALGAGTAVGEPVGELAVSADESLLTVVRCGPLSSLPWLTTIEVAPGRNLISLHDGVPVEKLEVALQDLLDTSDGMPERDRRVVRTLLERVRAPAEPGGPDRADSRLPDRAGGPPARLIRFRAPRARGCGGAAIRVESGAT